MSSIPLAWFRQRGSHLLHVVVLCDQSMNVSFAIGSGSASGHQTVAVTTPTTNINLEKVLGNVGTGENASDTSNHSRSSSKKSNHSVHSIHGKSSGGGSDWMGLAKTKGFQIIGCFYYLTGRHLTPKFYFAYKIIPSDLLLSRTKKKC